MGLELLGLHGTPFTLTLQDSLYGDLRGLLLLGAHETPVKGTSLAPFTGTSWGSPYWELRDSLFWNFTRLDLLGPNGALFIWTSSGTSGGSLYWNLTGLPLLGPYGVPFPGPQRLPFTRSSQDSC